MRLLSYDHHGKLCATRDLAHDQTPPYAILSHTWGADDQEVSFSDLSSQSYHCKEGYRKIEFCGRQAQKDGVAHFWVDTCCIDKSNNTELSTAITCMYRWYKNAHICYVYLADVSSAQNEDDTDANTGSPSNHEWELSFRRSRWFTRGWTLQELLAPKEVVFYSNEGVRLGTKGSLTHLLTEITRIPQSALRGKEPSQFTVDERLQWAHGRATKVPEDRAYCLLGIFDIYMPFVYGEGEHAFQRLQRKIAKQERKVPSNRYASHRESNQNDFFC